MANNHCYRWDDTNYTYRKQITIDHRLIGGDLIDFPLCVYITDDSILSDHSESTNGYDIIFYDCQGNLLDHELNYYNAGSIVVWVKIPEINPRDDKPIHMYYGKTGVMTDQSTCETWSNGYAMVLHMDDYPDNTHISDSTCHRYVGIKEGDGGDVPDEVRWGVHNAQLFDCTKHQRIRIDGVTDNITDGGCISIWWENTGDNPYGTAGGLINYRSNRPLMYYADTERLTTAWSNANDMPVGGGAYTGYKTLSEDVKYYTAFTWMTDEYWFYTDNMTLYENWNITDQTHSGTTCYIGFYSALQYFCGYIDEVRVSSVPRSRAWLVTEHDNQKEPGRFLSIGIEEEYDYNTCDTFIITSDTYTLTFNSPDYNNKDGQLRNNIDVFNFVTGSVNALNKGIDSESLVMSGKEYAKDEFTSIITKFENMDNIMENHEEIVISNLGSCFNGHYVLENFNYVISYKDYMSFRWVMTLEKKPTEGE